MQDERIPVGLCQCGCGERTTISPSTRKRFGYAKGEPRRFLRGHGGSKSREQYIVDEQTDCWVWQRSKTGSGYGKLWDGTKVALAHRVFFERAKGPIPDGLALDHLCRNRACVNPDHLEPVTLGENLRRGIRTRLNAEAVLEIRRRATAGEKYRAIGIDFGVAETTVSAVVNRHNWRHI